MTRPSISWKTALVAVCTVGMLACWPVRILGQEPTNEEGLVIVSPEKQTTVVRKILRLRGTVRLPQPIRMVLDIIHEDNTRARKPLRPYREAFDAYCVLKPGLNEISVKAIDGTDGRHRADVSVTYNPPASALRQDERKLVIEEPAKDAVLQSPILKIKGSATGFPDGAAVYLQLQAPSGTKSKQATLRDGRFSAYFVIIDHYNTLDVRCGDQIETIIFECKAPKGYKPPPEEPPPPPTDGGTAPVTAAAAPTRAVAAPVPIVDPDIKVVSPKQDQLMETAIIKVEGTVHNPDIVTVRLQLVNDGDATVKEVEVAEGAFGQYFVMKTPYPVVQVEGLTEDGTKVADDVVEFRCGKPKGWEGPLPWAYRNDVPDDPGASSGAPPVAAPVATHPANAGQASAGHTPVTTGPPPSSGSWEVVLVPIVIFIMLPIIIVRGQFILNKLSKKVITKAKTRPAVCEFCKAQGKRHFLAAVPCNDEGKTLLDGLIACTTLTSNDQVNEQLKPLLDAAQAYTGKLPVAAAPAGETVDVSCIWCRECKSGFLVIGDGEDEARHPLLAPVYFDWLLVSFGLH